MRIAACSSAFYFTIVAQRAPLRGGDNLAYGGPGPVGCFSTPACADNLDLNDHAESRPSSIAAFDGSDPCRNCSAFIDDNARQPAVSWNVADFRAIIGEHRDGVGIIGIFEFVVQIDRIACAQLPDRSLVLGFSDNSD